MNDSINDPQKRVVVAITGASGVIHGVRLLERLTTLSTPPDLDVIVTANGGKILDHEMGGKQWRSTLPGRLHPDDDLGDALASGSTLWESMVIVPCSMTTAARIAHGLGDTLVSRVASVALKERRSLIMIPRETPMSTIHLANLLELARAGAVIMPACPSYYSAPGSVEDIVDTVVDRILDHLKVYSAIPTGRRWENVVSHDP